MKSGVKRYDNGCSGWKFFWLSLCVVLCTAWVTQAALVTLVARVSYALLDSTGSSPLADGSTVYIFGSSDNQYGDGTDEMEVYAGTNLIANSTVGDDIFIGAVQIGDGTSSNGTFFTAQYEFDDTEVQYLYIRFFDTLDDPVSGYTDWNHSPLFAATNHPFGVERIDFIGDYATTNSDNFVVIPEPGTGNLLLLLAGLAWGMRLSTRKPKS